MDKEKLEKFRKLLEERLESLLNMAEDSRYSLKSGDDVAPDITDQATAERGRAFDLRIRDRERRLIGKIRESLRRIDDGTFGVCEECGEDISEKRLQARPVTTLCIERKMEAEQQEKAYH